MRTAIAGFGNILLGDDGFGVEVVKRLAATPLPDHVDVMDVGISGMDFVLKLMDGFDQTIVVDAVRRGQAPGTLYCFTPSEADLHLRLDERVDPHLAEPRASMRLAKRLGFLPKRVTIVGCEPQRCGLKMGLSIPVSAAVYQAVVKICALVDQATNVSRATE